MVVTGVGVPVRLRFSVRRSVSAVGVRGVMVRRMVRPFDRHRLRGAVVAHRSSIDL
jgi:hypothetical protein